MSSVSKSHCVLFWFLVLTVFTCHVMSRRLSEASTFETHEKWMAQYDKVYKDDVEKKKRFQIFNNNVQFIESFNAAGDKPFNLSINKFADLHHEEFKALLINGERKEEQRVLPTSTSETSFRYDNVNVTDIPSTIDWRTKGALTPVKDQGRCRCCWIFSAVAATEAIHQITTGNLVSLSEQELLDCVNGQSQGCSGGYVEEAFEFIAQQGGIQEASYPYQGVESTCKVQSDIGSSAVKIKGYEKVPPNSEEALLKAVAHQPVSVYISSGSQAMQFYRGGIFDATFCGTDTHVITVVGYGTAPDGTKYWLMKNSWGTEWGENGYIRMRRDISAPEGLCGIATRPFYPIASIRL